MNVNAAYGLFLFKRTIMVTKWNADVITLDNVEVQFSNGVDEREGKINRKVVVSL